MVWFQVDDNLAFHPKVIEAGNGAMGLWVRAGAWCMANLTDGFIPARVAYQLGSKSMCNRLVKVGLFEDALDGYRFHDWFDKQLAKSEVEARRNYDRKRKADQRKRHLTTVPEPSEQTPNVPPESDRTPTGLPPDSHRNPSGVTGAIPTQPIHGLGLGTNSPASSKNRGAAIRGGAANCTLCDEDGYRITTTGNPGAVCDHIDHQAQTTQSRALAAEVLAEIRARKANR